MTLTVCLIAFEQKDYLFKSLIADKLARLNFLKAQATAFFKIGNLKKALKLYLKVHSYFRTKDARNNFQKEDETTEAYQAFSKELEALNQTCLANVCVIQGKRKDWREVIRYADEALTGDPLFVKALYHKGRALLEMTEYQAAIEVLTKASECDPGNAEVKRELVRAETALKGYQDRQAKMFQKMFPS